MTAGGDFDAELDRVIADWLARLQGLSLHEIAERMGRTRNAVALLLSRALRKLKAAMDGKAPEPPP